MLNLLFWVVVGVAVAVLAVLGMFVAAISSQNDERERNAGREVEDWKP